MTPDDLFALAGAAVLPGWAILILAPRRWPVLNAVPAVAIPLALSAGYAALVLVHFDAAAAAGGGFGSRAAVRALFADDWMLLAGWVHYLAFDLALGAMAAAAMDRAGVGRILQGAILPLVFLLGPLGWFLAMMLAGGIRPAILTGRSVP